MPEIKSFDKAVRWIGRHLGKSNGLTPEQLAQRSPSTQSMYARVSRSPLYGQPSETAPMGFFAGRPIIDQDTPINGGVSLGGSAREAIVVDDKKDRTLDRIFNDVKKYYLDPNILVNHREYGAASIVLWIVQRDLPNDMKKAEEISDGITPDQKVYLGQFISERAGVCRHQSLLAGYLMERLIKEGLIQGKVSVKRKDNRTGPHAWAEYKENSSSESIVIDATHGFVGTLDEAAKALPIIYAPT